MGYTPINYKIKCDRCGKFRPKSEFKGIKMTNYRLCKSCRTRRDKNDG